MPPEMCHELRLAHQSFCSSHMKKFVLCCASRASACLTLLPRAQCFHRQMGIQTSPTQGTSQCEVKLCYAMWQWLEDDIAYRTILFIG